ncbi:MAG: UbiA family prenyltransferase [Pseudomonadota bacterium]
MTTDLAPKGDKDIVLVSDLDGTLCKTDTLQEAALAMIARQPMAVVKLPGWLKQGRAALKENIVNQGLLSAETLPMNDDVIEALKAARAEGRRTALVSASDERQVKAIAEATGLFDEAHGTADGKNLKGEAKAAFLTDHFGAKGFDYIGDAKADLPVWAAARRAITVQAGPDLKKAAEAANADAEHISPPDGKARAVLKAMRPHQWSKNVLLFLPLLAAHDMSRLGPVVLGFIAFCLTASAVYVINDLLDLAGDRAHPRKSKRPFASGALSGLDGAVLSLGLLLAGLIAGLLVGNPAFLAVLLVYLTATFAYSLWLKRKLIVDVITLAGLYTIRILAGGAAASIVLSPWILGFGMFLFLSLAAVKRQAELTDQVETGRASAGRAYQPEDLPVLRGLAMSAGNASILVLALYISSDSVQALYSRPEILWLICPILLYWVVRMVMQTHRRQMTDDPIVYAASDRTSVILIAAAGLVALTATLWPGA